METYANHGDQRLVLRKWPHWPEDTQNHPKGGGYRSKDRWPAEASIEGPLQHPHTSVYQVEETGFVESQKTKPQD